MESDRELGRTNVNAYFEMKRAGIYLIQSAFCTILVSGPGSG